MPNDEGVVSRLVARVKALLPEDWVGKAGLAFREGVDELSEFSERHRLAPDEILDDAVVLGRRKIEGMASVEHATAEKNYAEATRAFSEGEDKKIDMELKRRSLDSEVRKKAAEATLAQVQAVDALFELRKKLAAAGLAVIKDGDGNLTMLPSGETDEGFR